MRALIGMCSHWEVRGNEGEVEKESVEKRIVGRMSCRKRVAQGRW